MPINWTNNQTSAVFFPFFEFFNENVSFCWPGFELNIEILSFLMVRYMRRDGTLRFGDFVHSILHLCLAFTLFEKKDQMKSGVIKLNLSEWIKACLLS